MNILIFNILKENKKFLIFIFLFSFLMRALVFNFYLSKNKNYCQVDSDTYHKIAISISKGEGVSVNGSPNFYRLPGYSYFLAFYYKYFGEDTKNVLWIQIILASIIPILIFLLSFVLVPYNLFIACASSFYSAIHIGFVLYSGFFMTETLFIFLFLIFAILFFSGKYLFLSGLFLGLSGLVRPVGHYLIFLSVLILFFYQNTLGNKIKKSAGLFLGWFFAVFPWLLRNYLLLGQIFFHTLPGGHFLHFSASRNLMREINCSFNQANEILRKKVNNLVSKKESKKNRKLTEVEICDIRQNLAIQYFKKYPFVTIKNWLTDILRTSLSLYSSEIVRLESKEEFFDYFSQKRTIFSLFKKYLVPDIHNNIVRLLIYLEIFLFGFILLGVIWGFILALILYFKFNQHLMLNLYFKVLPIVFLFLFIGLAGGYSRMRLPVEPFLIILAFNFWVFIFRKYVFDEENVFV